MTTVGRMLCLIAATAACVSGMQAGITRRDFDRRSTTMAFQPGAAFADTAMSHVRERGSSDATELRLSAPWDINDAGEIVGLCTLPHRFPHVCLWNHGALVDTGIISSPFSSATINERGQVLTVTACPEGGERIVFWARGEILPLGECVQQVSGWDLSDSGRAVWNSSSMLSDDVIVWTSEQEFVLPSRNVSGGNNNRGQVAGAGPDGGFLWDNGTFTPLGRWFQPTNLNDQGQVIGFLYEPGDDGPRAGLWDNGVATRLEPLPGHYFNGAYGINARGQVVGWSGDYGSSRAVLWERGTVVELLPDGNAWAINDRGQVLGDARGGSFLWDHGSVSYFGYARAMNERGQVVGIVRDGEDWLPFIWENGTMIELNTGQVIPPPAQTEVPEPRQR
jgi:probable HAF family extracellular repeat protein